MAGAFGTATIRLVKTGGFCPFRPRHDGVFRRDCRVGNRVGLTPTLPGLMGQFAAPSASGSAGAVPSAGAAAASAGGVSDAGAGSVSAPSVQVPDATSPEA